MGNRSGSHLAVTPMCTADMKAGESYESWICQACNNVIAFAPRDTDDASRHAADALVSIQCPHCNAQRYYAIHDRRVRQYIWATL